MNVYDIALDFILLDAFDDLDNPPSAIVAVLQNRWITPSMKTSVSLPSSHSRLFCSMNAWIHAGLVSCHMVHLKSKEKHAEGKLDTPTTSCRE